MRKFSNSIIDLLMFIIFTAIVFSPIILTLITRNGWWLTLYAIGFILLTLAVIMFTDNISGEDDYKDDFDMQTQLIKFWVKQYPNDNDLGKIVRSNFS